MRRMLVSVLVLLSSSMSIAHEAGTYQWVGQTTTPLVGTAGFLTLTTQCRTDFGPGARMCTGAEIQGSSTLEVDGIAEAGCWVRPEPLTAAGVSLDRTGIITGASPNCGQWTTSGTNGLIFTHDGRFDLGQCDEARPVACCMPVFAPKPPACRGVRCGPR